MAIRPYHVGIGLFMLRGAAASWGRMAITPLRSIRCPCDGIVDYVTADAIVVILVSDDVFVITALPHWFAGRSPHPVNLFCGGGFETTYDGPDRS